jgi:hypothetical protein
VNLNLASALPTTAARNLIEILLNSYPQVGTLIIPTLSCIKAGVLPASSAELTGYILISELTSDSLLNNNSNLLHQLSDSFLINNSYLQLH